MTAAASLRQHFHQIMRGEARRGGGVPADGAAAATQWAVGCFEGGADGATHLAARWLINTVALLLSASSASFWICVLPGRTPLARRMIIERGRPRSCDKLHQSKKRGGGRLETWRCTREAANRELLIKTW